MREVFRNCDLSADLIQHFLSGERGKSTDINILVSAAWLKTANDLADDFNRTNNMNIRVFFMHDYPERGWAIVNSIGSFVSHEEIK